MRLRPEQLDAFQPEAEAAFEERLVDYLLENYLDSLVRLPVGTSARIDQIPERTLLSMVRHGIARARRYGLSWESTITGFVVLMFEIAPNFDEHPAVQCALTDETIPPDMRLDILVERTSDADWEMAEGNYEPKAWLPTVTVHALPFIPHEESRYGSRTGNPAGPRDKP